MTRRKFSYPPGSSPSPKIHHELLFVVGKISRGKVKASLGALLTWSAGDADNNRRFSFVHEAFIGYRVDECAEYFFSIQKVQSRVACSGALPSGT